MGIDPDFRARNVTAVLGPTNTGKTHLAIERMLDHQSGMIGLPLRLLAREVYDRVVAKVGALKVALVTGEEKIRPENPKYWVCTVEAMPLEIPVEFLCVDEIQLAADPDRGHVFTDRLLFARGISETMLLGSHTMRDTVGELIPGANFIARPRFSKLSWAGQKKITRLPKRSAIVTFSATEVYAIAELIRRQMGGAAVVLGALSPRTRNAQVALYQSGDVDFLVATDAIGMGLNLDVDHIAFAATRKFDGQSARNLTPGEIGQIAGRAGRYMNDGTFGVTADIEPFDPDLIDRLETHTFDSLKTLQWRNRDLDYHSPDALLESLKAVSGEVRLQRARTADDQMALEAVMGDPAVMELAKGRDAVSRLWDVCQIPDFRKISNQSHAELIATVYKFIARADGRIPEDWFAAQVAFSDRTDGDIDTLATRIAHIRTWTYVANRASWFANASHWQERTRAIEDSLSDALHEQLTMRFVDRRTSALMKGMRDKQELAAEIGSDGAIKVEDHFVGRLSGFRFQPEMQGDGTIHGKAARQAAAQVVTKELAMRARRVAAAKADAFKLTRRGRILWREEEIARLEASDNLLEPKVVLLTDEHLVGPDRDKVQTALDTWLKETIAERLKPLIELAEAEDVAGLARGIAFRMRETLGILKRDIVADEVKSLDQAARGQLRKYGVRFGAFNIYIPALLKPAVSELRLVLWALKHASEVGLSIDTLPEAPRAGLTSFLVTEGVPEAYYRAFGFHPCGPRVIRVDMLERLADLIRPLVAWRPDGKGDAANPPTPPKGSTGEGGFVVVPEMMSILGCSSEELGGVLKALGFWNERRPARPKPAAISRPTKAAYARGKPLSPIAAAALAAMADAAPVVSEPVVSEAVAAVPAQPLSPIAAAMAAAESDPGATPAVPVETDGSAAPATSVTSAEPLPPAEPEMEEVWRPRRRTRGDHQPRRGRGDDQRADAERGDAARSGWRGRPGGRGPDRGPRDDRASVDAKPAAGDGSDRGSTPERERDHRNERHRGGRDRDHRGADRSDRPRGDRPRGDRPPREGGNAVVARSQAPSRKGVDPDSPFAALGALKLALESKARDQSK